MRSQNVIDDQCSVFGRKRPPWRAAGLRRIRVLPVERDSNPVHPTRRPSITLGPALALWLVLTPSAPAATNELVNGGFDDPKEPLKGWVHNYEWTGNKFYRDNHTRLSVVKKDGTKKGVLKLTGTRDILWGTGQGIKLDSEPVPFDPDAVYELIVEARTQAATSKPGPNCRIYIEGYQWKPGIKPHARPSLHELRKVYKQGSGNILYFGKAKSGPFSNAQKKWSKGSCTFPSKELSPAAGRHMRRIRFICVHIVAIDGWDGDILINEVKLEKKRK